MKFNKKGIFKRLGNLILNIKGSDNKDLLPIKANLLLLIDQLKLRSGDLVQCEFVDGNVILVQVNYINYCRRFERDHTFTHRFELVDKYCKYDVFTMKDIKIINRSHRSKKLLISNKAALKQDIKQVKQGLALDL